MNAKKSLWVAGLMALVLVGCKDPSERLEGPGGCRLQPIVHGGTRFVDDRISIPVEAMAKNEENEPQILQVQLVVTAGAVVAPPNLRTERWHGKFGYGETAYFDAPPGVDRFKAVLLVHHLSSIFEMIVPFEQDPENRATNKWVMGKESVREVGTTVMSRSAKPPAP